MKVISNILISLIVLPWLVQFQHLFSSHKIDNCEIRIEHLHDLNDLCECPDYNLNKTISIQNYISDIFSIHNFDNRFGTPSLSIKKTFFNRVFKRGPPLNFKFGPIYYHTKQI